MAGINFFYANYHLRGPIGKWYGTIMAVKVTVGGYLMNSFASNQIKVLAQPGCEAGNETCYRTNDNGCKHTYDWPNKGENRCNQLHMD